MASLDHREVITREISIAEVEHYQENGWVKLERLIDPRAAADVLKRAVQLMQLEPQHDADTPKTRPDSPDTPLSPSKLRSVFEVRDFPARDDEYLNTFSHSPELARVALKLMRGRLAKFGGSCENVRFFQDQILAKQPAAQGGDPTPWHQDLNLQPFDRFGALVVWIALVDIPPERGALQFLSGSHELPPLGRIFHRADKKDLLTEYPKLLDQFEVSPPLNLHPGDATVHDYCVVHSAPINQTDSIRWSYLVEFFPAQTLYTGMPSRQTTGLGLAVNEHFEHDHFPIISAS